MIMDKIIKVNKNKEKYAHILYIIFVYCVENEVF